MHRLLSGFVFAILAIPAAARADDLKIPAFTAYIDPHFNAARVTGTGITGWQSDDHIIWGGSLTPGELHATLLIALPKGDSARLSLTISGQTRQVDAKGTGDAAPIDFGAFQIKTGGYQRIELAGISKSGKTFGDISELDLAGPSTLDAIFNLKPRRNAASVHLNYPTPSGVEIASFYNELTPRADPVASYYMACGFSRGYFGMQVNSPTERRIIFSIWDAGNEAKDRKNVDKENLVTLLAKGDGVDAGSFGNEGTGGHSHLKYMWKTGQTQKFLVTARADGDATIYSGYFFFSETQKWGLIASFRAPHDGKLLRGLYSFNEDFDGMNGHLQRLCGFGNQWIESTDGHWIELTAARFTHDGTGDKDRKDYGSGVTPDGKFFLSNGGFVANPPTGPLKRPGNEGGKPKIVLPVTDAK